MEKEKGGEKIFFRSNSTLLNLLISTFGPQIIDCLMCLFDENCEKKLRYKNIISELENCFKMSESKREEWNKKLSENQKFGLNFKFSVILLEFLLYNYLMEVKKYGNVADVSMNLFSFIGKNKGIKEEDDFFCSIFEFEKDFKNLFFDFLGFILNLEKSGEESTENLKVEIEDKIGEIIGKLSSKIIEINLIILMLLNLYNFNIRLNTSKEGNEVGEKGVEDLKEILRKYLLNLGEFVFFPLDKQSIYMMFPNKQIEFPLYGEIRGFDELKIEISTLMYLYKLFTNFYNTLNEEEKNKLEDLINGVNWKNIFFVVKKLTIYYKKKKKNIYISEELLFVKMYFYILNLLIKEGDEKKSLLEDLGLYLLLQDPLNEEIITNI